MRPPDPKLFAHRQQKDGKGLSQRANHDELAHECEPDDHPAVEDRGAGFGGRAHGTRVPSRGVLRFEFRANWARYPGSTAATTASAEARDNLVCQKLFYRGKANNIIKAMAWSGKIDDIVAKARLDVRLNRLRDIAGIRQCTLINCATQELA